MFDNKSNRWVAVGNVETSFVTSTLLRCRDEQENPIFVYDKMANEADATRDVLRINVDSHQSTQTNVTDEAKLFERRTAVLDKVTNQLLTLGVISQKHSDMYPVSPLTHQVDYGNHQQLALVNRSTAPYLGIDSVGVHLHCYVCKEIEGSSTVHGVWLAKRAPTKSHHPNFWDPTVAGGQPVNLSLYENIIKEAYEEAGVPSDWLCHPLFTDHTEDPLTITTAKPDGSCLKRSIYYSFDLQVSQDWSPTAVDGEVSEFKLYSIPELEEELMYGDSIRPAMRSVLLDFMIRHGLWKESYNGEVEELRKAMRRNRMSLW
jgi:isopentenyldiphosphate isomerase